MMTNNSTFTAGIDVAKAKLALAKTIEAEVRVYEPDAA